LNIVTERSMNVQGSLYSIVLSRQKKAPPLPTGERMVKFHRWTCLSR